MLRLRNLAATIGGVALLTGCAETEDNSLPTNDDRAAAMPSRVADVNADIERIDGPLSFDQFRTGQSKSFAFRDTDADGIVEIADLSERYGKEFKRMDRDKDGRVTRDELERSVADRFRLADKNRDKVLQPEEWK